MPGRNLAATANRRRRIKEITDWFKEEIAKGNLRPGDQAPTNICLQSQFKCGADLVQVARRQMVEEGIFEIRVPKGGKSKCTMVCDSKQVSDLIEQQNVG